MHLQTKLNSWAEGHFHVGRVPINSEAGVEFAMSLLMPVEDTMGRSSLDPMERDGGIDYLSMAKLTMVDAIAFATVTGLTIVVHSKGLSGLFGPSEKCKHCKIKESSVIIPNTIPAGEFDSLMELTGNEKSH